MAGQPGSPITQLLQYTEVSLWAEGIDPETALRVLNRLLLGDPGGHAAVSPGLSPEWLGGYARKLADLARRTIAGVMRDNGEDPTDVDLAARRTEQLLWDVVRDLHKAGDSHA